MNCYYQVYSYRLYVRLFDQIKKEHRIVRILLGVIVDANDSILYDYNDLFYLILMLKIYYDFCVVYFLMCDDNILNVLLTIDERSRVQ